MICETGATDLISCVGKRETGWRRGAAAPRLSQSRPQRLEHAVTAAEDADRTYVVGQRVGRVYGATVLGATSYEGGGIEFGTGKGTF